MNFSWRPEFGVLRVRWKDMAKRVPKRSLVLPAALIALCALSVGFVQHRRAVVGAVQEHPYFRVDHIKIRGVGTLVHEEEIRDWLGLGEGQSLWRVYPREIARRLESHPMIRAASARRVFPNTLEIRVRERKPAAISVLNGLYYVDRRGEFFGPLGGRHDRDFPVFTGLRDGSDGQQRWTLRRALRLLRRGFVRQGVEVSEMHLDPERGLVLYPSRPSVPILLGWRSWEVRLGKALRALGEWPGDIRRLARVDVRYRDQILMVEKVMPSLGNRSAPLGQVEI